MSKVFFKDISKPYIYSRCDSEFLSVLSETDKENIVKYSVKNTTNLFNGVTVRLNSIKYNDGIFIFSISKMKYFDSLVSNMLFHKYSSKTMEVGNEVERNIARIVNNISNAGISSFESILSNNNLANTIAVSVMVRDINGLYGLVHRTSNVAIGAGLLSVTVTGALDENDYSNNDPVLSCAIRELNEELGITAFNYRVDFVAISKSKLQPIFIINADLNEEWSNVMKNFNNASDYNKEVSSFTTASIGELNKLVADNQMTDAARFHIEYIMGKKAQ